MGRLQQLGAKACCLRIARLNMPWRSSTPEEIPEGISQTPLKQALLHASIPHCEIQCRCPIEQALAQRYESCLSMLIAFAASVGLAVNAICMHQRAKQQHNIICSTANRLSQTGRGMYVDVSKCLLEGVSAYMRRTMYSVHAAHMRTVEGVSAYMRRTMYSVHAAHNQGTPCKPRAVQRSSLGRSAHG